MKKSTPPKMGPLQACLCSRQETYVAARQGGTVSAETEFFRTMPAREKSNERRANMIPPRQVASSGHMPTLDTQAGPAGLALMGR